MCARVGLTLTTVVQAAIKLADTNGIESVTLASLAMELGVRTPSLYNHVDGLPGLRRELALHGIRELGHRLSQAAIGKAEDDAVLAIAMAYRTFAKEHPGLYEATLHAPNMADATIRRASDDVVQTLFTVMQPYGLTEEGTIHAVRGLRSLAHGFTTLDAAGGFGLAVSRDESYQRMLNIFLWGLRRGEELGSPGQ
jgi:AcrR family transcriptional regulator